MTANGLQPSFIKIYEHSSFAPHVRTLPIRQWNIGGAPTGSCLNWDGGTQDIDIMVTGLVNKIKPLMLPSYAFDYYEVWNYPDPDGLPIPVATAPLAIVGTSTSTGWSEAVEQTFNFQTALFGKAKLILLDVPTDNFFGKVAPADFGAAVLALVNEFMDVANGWAGRDNSRPAIVRNATITLNEKLRRSYRLT